MRRTIWTLSGILFVVFMFCTTVTKAQGPQQMFYALNQNEYLLDMMPNATHSVAYSVRKLRAGYSGFALRVRRSGGGGGTPQADVAFDARGMVSENSMVTIAVKGSSSYTVGQVVSWSTFFASSAYNGFVSVWYDQTTNGNDATQSSTGGQPQIVASGALIKENGVPTIEFSGVHSTEKLTLNSAVNLTSATLFGVCRVVAAPSTVAIADNGTYSYNLNTFNNTGYLGVTYYSVSDDPSTLSYSGSLNAYSWSKLSTNPYVELNNRSGSSTSARNIPIAVSQVYGNALSTSTLRISEFVITSYASPTLRSAVFESQRLVFKTP